MRGKIRCYGVIYDYLRGVDVRAGTCSEYIGALVRELDALALPLPDRIACVLIGAVWKHAPSLTVVVKKLRRVAKITALRIADDRNMEIKNAVAKIYRIKVPAMIRTVGLESGLH
jgi:hypothetical protein